MRNPTRSLPATLALLATVAYLAVAPLLAYPASAHDGSRALQLALLAVVSLLAVTGSVGLRATAPDSLKACAAACLAIALPSLLAAPDRAAAAQEVALMLGLATLALQVCRAARGNAVGWIYDGLLAGCCTYFLLTTGIYGVALLDSGAGPLNARLLHLGFDNPRFFNHLQTLALPVLLGWSVAAPDRLRRRAATVAASLHFAWLFMDVARASLLALAVATVWCCWVGARPLWRRLLLCALAGFVIHWVLFVALPIALGRSWFTHFAGLQELTSSHSRDLLLSAALDLMRDHPWLGAGPMHYAALAHPKGAHPHNLYLQWAAEFGLPSLLLLVAVLAIPLWRASALLRQAQSESPAMTAALGAALLAALVDAGFSGNFVMPLSQVWIAVVYGLLLAALPTGLTLNTPLRTRLRGLALAGLLAFQVWLCVIAWHQWQHVPPRISDLSPITTADQKPRPRFWQQGWL